MDTFETSWTIIGYYEQRPLIEEFHKGIKTGCHVEERGPHQIVKRLETVTAMMSVVAVRLLQMIPAWPGTNRIARPRKSCQRNGFAFCRPCRK